MGYAAKDWFVFWLTNVFSLLAIVGNAFVIYVIYKKKRSSTTFVLIGSQAASDICYGVLRALAFFTCSEWFANTNRLTRLLCETNIWFYLSCFSISSITIMVVAIERFYMLYFPHKPKLTSRQTALAIVAIWTTALSASFLAMIGLYTRMYFGEEKFATCFVAYAEWSKLDFFAKQYGFWIFTTAVFYLPMTVSSVLYVLVVRKVLSLRVIGLTTEAKDRAAQKQRERTVLMVVALMLAYFVLCSPITIFTQYIVVKLGIHTTCGKGSVVSFPFIFLNMLLASTLVNPLILCYFNVEFREEAKRLLHLGQRRSQNIEQSSSQVTQATAAV